MKPVKQTAFGKPKGNCFAACLATLLEVPLKEVPHIFGPGEDDARWDVLHEYLATKGCAFIDFPWDTFRCHTTEDGILAIVTGHGSRGLLHCVIFKSKEGDSWIELHDPHPDRDFLRGDPVAIGFLVKR